MKKQDLWARYRKYAYTCPGLALGLDVSRMNFSDSIFDELRGVLSDALEAMAELERGAIANPDEGRMVGHYWLRAPELAPTSEITRAIRAAQSEILDFAKKVHEGQLRSEHGEKFSHLLLVGIGGSALGPQFLADALGGAGDLLSPNYLDNTDPDGIARQLEKLRSELDRTLVLVVSKSGGTAETYNGMLETIAAYHAEGLSFSKHAVAITGAGSKLYEKASEEQWLKIFPMWDWVGGRTSVTGPVGLVPAALQGIDVASLLAGARLMDIETRIPDIRSNPAALLAAMWYTAGKGRGEKEMVLLPYKDRLILFSRYLQQLVMESLGKALDLKGTEVNQGLTVYGNKGSTDQHAYVQQLREGPDNFFVTFIEVLRDREGPQLELRPGITSGDYLLGFLLGTRQALFEKGRESITLTIDRVDARSVGALIALYERAVGLYASLIGINAYHQPGVEAGKKAANAVLELQGRLLEQLEEGGRGNAEELAARCGAPDQRETIYKLLEHLSANDRIQRTSSTTPFDAIYHR